MEKFLAVPLRSEVDIHETMNIAFITLGSDFNQAYEAAMKFMDRNIDLHPEQVTFDAFGVCKSISASYVIGGTSEWDQLMSATNQTEVDNILAKLDDSTQNNDRFSANIIINFDGTIQFTLLPDNTVDIALCFSEQINLNDID
ncbi:hypothetical protein [Photobacterium damselae]|uniref:hypothetical protein n=1 Tax=Photobacterium damselae TaxID=38293 RepID=UPI001F324C1F|nr:hypothetical protein [Photobacterium damselae]UKA05006.1 hypothetical protein IHC89_22430 [Photobacterium damselae subsp. damselae]